jgi:hypothetical protein
MVLATILQEEIRTTGQLITIAEIADMAAMDRTTITTIAMIDATPDGTKYMVVARESISPGPPPESTSLPFTSGIVL